jgi:cellulose synthase/poly-beta-1,6-N-acetylglucosamine synthase-like glycosyltransferase
MQLVLQILFWSCVLLMLHSYMLFPLLLQLLARNKKDNDIVFDMSDDLPHVFILMSVYNEQKVIREKLDSVFDTDYPLDKLSFYIGSDHSSDQTNAIIEEYAKTYPQINFYPFTERNGKSGVLNKLYSEITSPGRAKASSAEHRPANSGDVFILTDANVLFTRSCIFEMVKHFKNKDIGQVAANVLNKGQRKDGISIQEAGYIQRENLIKYREGLVWGAMQGAFGACYAMRASCFSPIPANFLMEDFYLSMSILCQGKKAISEFKSVCYEDVSNDVREEFKRKTRISTGNYQNLGVYWTRLFKFDAVAFCFYSHKIIRWKGPFMIILMLLSSAMLAVSMPFYLLALVLMVLFLISPLIDNGLKAMGVNIGLLRLIAYFNMMNWALLYGFYKYMTGVQTSAWSPTKRNI